MSNMPILSNNAAATSKANKHSTANTNANDEASPNTQPFGEVLARQLSDKILIDVKGLMETKADAKPLEMVVSDVAIVAAVDPLKIENSTDNLAVSLPNDMLATLSPQTAAAAAAAMNIPTQPSVSDDKRAIASDKQKSTMNASDLTLPLTTGGVVLKTAPSITSSKESASATDNLKSAIVAPELTAGEIALNTMPSPSASKDASTSDKLKGATVTPDLTAGVIAQNSVASITTSKEAASSSGSLKSATVAPDLTAGKAGLKTMPSSINTSKDASPNSTRVGADVVAFAKEVELRNKLDATLAVPSTQATTPQANLVQSMANVSPVGPQAVQLVIDTPIAQKQWGNDFSQKITWMATQQDQHAELHLNPAQLGPVDVVIKVSGDQATAQFTSAHAAVREVIEQSIPKLREMLADNGIMLGNTTVSDQAPREQRGEFGNQRQTAPSGRLLESAPSNMSDTRVIAPLSRHNGMVDTFA